MKIAIGVGPVAGITMSQIAANPNPAGVQQALGTLTSAYTGYDVSTGTIKPQNLVLGYVPLLGAWAFGKIASRVLK